MSKTEMMRYRQGMRIVNLKHLADAGIQVEMESIHHSAVEFNSPSGRVRYWPETGKWVNLRTGHKGGGTNEMLSIAMRVGV